jgi:outer membrane protein
MKKHLTGFLLLGLWLLAWGSLAWAEDTKLGIVDAQKIFEGSKIGKKDKLFLEDYVKTRQRLLESEEADLKKLESDLQQQQAVMTPGALQQKAEEFRQRVEVYQRHVQEMQGEVEAKKRELLGAFSKKVEQVVAEIAVKERILLVLERGAGSVGTMVLFNTPSIDITDQVIKALDSKGGN